MNTEPTLTYQIFDILLQVIVFIVVMGIGFVFLAVVNRFIDFSLKPRPKGRIGWTPPSS